MLSEDENLLYLSDSTAAAALAITVARGAAVVHGEGVHDLHRVDDADAADPLCVVAAEEVGQGHQVLPVQPHL